MRTTILEFTLLFKNVFSEIGLGERLEGGYVFSIDGSGDPMFINKDKQVEIFYHDNDDFKMLSDSFEEFIEENIT